jgi:hypothetical protein
VYIRAGTLRALAVTSAMRSQALPDIPRGKADDNPHRPFAPKRIVIRTGARQRPRLDARMGGGEVLALARRALADLERWRAGDGHAVAAE